MCSSRVRACVYFSCVSLQLLCAVLVSILCMCRSCVSAVLRCACVALVCVAPVRARDRDVDRKFIYSIFPGTKIDQRRGKGNNEG